MGSISVLADARIKKDLTTKVYDCGKCGSQGARLNGDGTIVCGGHDDKGDDCTAKWACTWYEPTDSKTKAKYMRPRLPKPGKSEGSGVYRCGHCLFHFFHIQSDGSITCYREACKRKALFRWNWIDGVR